MKKVILLFVVTLLFLNVNTHAQEIDSTEFESQEESNDYNEPMSDEEFDKLMNTPTTSSSSGEESLKKVELAVKVVDAKTKQPLQAYIEITAKTNKGKRFSGVGNCDPKGIFSLLLSANSKIKISVSYGAYMPETEYFDLEQVNEKDKDEVKKLVKLTPISEGELIPIENISFQQGKFKIDKSSYKDLDKLVTLLQNNPKMMIEIAGHTDDTGSKDASQKLSEERVDAVKEYLVAKGVDSKRVKGIGYGSSQPLLDGNSADAHEKNRRVEFKILKM